MIYQGKTDVKPEEIGFNPAKLNDLDALFQDLIKQEQLQCASYLLARNGKIFAHRSMGKLSGLEDKGDLQPDSIRWIASITKIFTATAIMRLIEQGKIYLKQPVSTIIKEFNNEQHSTITIFHLLTHTSGLASDPGAYREPYPRKWHPDGIDESNWIEYLLEGPLENEPGKVWSYCSKGFNFLGEIIARVSGMTYPEYIMKNIIKPLEMNFTYFTVPGNLQAQVCLVSEFCRKHLLQEWPQISPSLQASGDLYSTLGDLFKLGQMFLNNGIYNGIRILSRKSIDAMTRNHLENIPQFCWSAKGAIRHYGLGLRLIENEIVTPESYGHGGFGRSFIVLDPKEKLLFVYFIPTAIPWVPDSEINSRQIVWAGLQ